MKAQRGIDSKFRFVIIASKRAKQLLQGAKPRLRSKSKNPIRVAQREVREGLVGYELVEFKKEEIPQPAEEGFIGEEIAPGSADEEKGPKEPKVKKAKPKKKTEAAKKKTPQKKAAKKTEAKKKTTKKKA